MRSDRAMILANGESREISLPCSVDEFVKSRGFKSSQVVVECNGNVLERSSFGVTMLRSGDRLEIIVPVAGG